MSEDNKNWLRNAKKFLLQGRAPIGSKPVDLSEIGCVILCDSLVYTSTKVLIHFRLPDAKVVQGEGQP